MKLFKLKLLIPLLAILNSGCTSFGKGVAQAFLEKEEAKDTRACQIRGESFPGLEPFVDDEQTTTRVLMVHGVGDRGPGYSTQLMEELAKELNLNFIGKRTKNLSLTNPMDTSKELGNLRVNQLLNKDQTRELLFYELTWSEITADEKQILAYDNSGEQTFRRADINKMMKSFSNDTGPDPMIYLGNSQEDILVSFAQSFCWMVSYDWDLLPLRSNQFCLPDTEETIGNVRNDHFAFVTHSLGSRIAIDGLQRMATVFADLDNNVAKMDNSVKTKLKKDRGFVEVFRNIKIPVYMLSNQLPMLQLGRTLPEITGRTEAYCFAEGEHYQERMVSQTNIIAFSDPNDILSYSLPLDFAEKYLDSRLCVGITNININIAKEVDVFGLGTYANPMVAHIGYDTDERVVALIAKGFGNSNTAPIVTERCTSLVTVE